MLDVRPILALVFATLARTRGSALPYVVGLLRDAFRAEGIPSNPVGADAAKLGVPGTYRPVGPSCPQDCALLGDCYASENWVGRHQARADLDLTRSAASVAIAIGAALHCGTFARLHISGDWLKFGRIDEAYVYAVCEIAESLRHAYDDDWPASAGWVAYTYTHASRADFERYRARLAHAGVSVVYSVDRTGQSAGEAFIVPPDEHRQWAGTRLPDGSRVVACPAQLTHNAVKCRDCGACVGAEHKRLAIAFAAHGGLANGY